MASCAPPVGRACALSTLVLWSLAAAPGVAKDRPPAAAAARIGAEALERLKSARDRQAQHPSTRGPGPLPVPTAADDKRAFEGLRRRQAAPAIDARAHAALDEARKGMAAERAAMARRIGEALGLDPPDLKAIAGTQGTPREKAWVPVLFASSSMPTSTLRSYAAQLERVRGVIAFRGMPGGLTKVAPMARLTAAILRIDPGCEGAACAMRDVQVIVDPLLFRQHAITQVPAITMLPGDPARPYCERDDTSPRGSHLVLGDAALSGLLEEYARLGGKAEVGDAAARLESR